jgi:hypothetical protein
VTYSAYSAFSALLFRNWGPTASVQSRDKSAGWNSGTCRLAKAGPLSFHLMVGIADGICGRTGSREQRTYLAYLAYFALFLGKTPRGTDEDARLIIPEF